MRTRKAGRAAAGAVAVAVAAGIAVLGAGAGTAAADDHGALDTCLASVQGAPGQQVTLAPAAVLQPIGDALTPLDPLGTTGSAFRQSWPALPPIPVGAIPSVAGVIPGDAIAGAVVDRLRTVPAVAPVIDVLAPRVWLVVAQGCAVAVQPVGPLVAPLTGGQQPAPPPASPPPGGGNVGGSPGGGSSGGGSAGGRPAPAPAGGGSAPWQAPGSGSAGGVPPEQATVWGQVPGGSGAGVPPEGVMVYNSGPLPQPWTVPGGIRAPGNGLSVHPTDMTGQAAPLASARHPRPGVSEVIVLATLMLAFVGAQLARAWARRPARSGWHAAGAALPPRLRRLLRNLLRRLLATLDTAG
ncbi:hypothetical protein [Gandjariella thermophila]|uniref:Uncharacterized protein n=1 Tax=Gandjariella thermophila TaxID=1931992 RepID=A0A4D4JFI6_9PSEU|nr:hypothetical protein [Gandjariella thermophila]GDY33166.1 hypothetical protein GTS_47990 [Gandjariella thermophila]